MDYGIVRALCERHEVTLLAPEVPEYPVGPGRAEFEKYCKKVITIPFPEKEKHLSRRTYRRMKREIRYWTLYEPLEVSDIAGYNFLHCLKKVFSANTYDLAEIEYWHMGPLLTNGDIHCPRILLQHSTHHGNVLYALNSGSTHLRSRIRNWFYMHTAMAQYETKICRKFNWVFFLTPDDQKIVNREGALSGKTGILPIPFLIPSSIRPNLTKTRSLIFIGSMQTPYNISSVRHFCTAILPILVQKIPSISLSIVGTPPSPKVLRELQSPHIRFLGYQEDLAACLQNHSALIAPVVNGTGIRTKIIEALAQGTPVVSTPMGIEGMCVKDGRDIVIADTNESFAFKLVQLLTDDGFRQNIAENALKRFRISFAYSAIKSSTVSAYENVIQQFSAREMPYAQSGKPRHI